MAVVDVNLYIEVSTQQVNKCRRRYIYVLEAPGKNATKTATGIGENVSLDRAVLTAVERGVSRIKKPVRITIYMGCRYILMPLENGSYQKWEENGFRTAKGGQVKNQDLWIRVKKLLDRHVWHGEGYAEHSYQKRMLYDLEKWKERDGEETGNMKEKGGTAG